MTGEGEGNHAATTVHRRCRPSDLTELIALIAQTPCGDGCCGLAVHACRAVVMTPVRALLVLELVLAMALALELALALVLALVLALELALELGWPPAWVAAAC